MFAKSGQTAGKRRKASYSYALQAPRPALRRHMESVILLRFRLDAGTTETHARTSSAGGMHSQRLFLSPFSDHSRSVILLRFSLSEAAQCLRRPHAHAPP